jgi:type II secretory pathway pseudopilin PulG
MQIGRRQQGFTYLAMLFAVLALGIMLAAAGLLWQTQVKREKEAELLFIGAEFRRAIASYYRAIPSQPAYPASLEDLLQDMRFVDTRRHLRRIYADPFTGKAEWGLIDQPGGGIAGVYSLAEGVPLKQGNFHPDDLGFEGKGAYHEWHFIARPPPVAVPASPQAEASPPGN